MKHLDAEDTYISIEEVSGEDENDELVVPCMDESAVPCIGMRFKTHKEAYDFYNSYACRVGFSVRRQCTSKSKKGVSSMRFVCSKHGFGKRQKIQEMRDDDPNLPRTPQKERAFTRVGCNASFRIKLVEGGSWEVSVFQENHNHPLVTSPSKKQNLRSQKRISNEKTETIINFSAQNVGTTQILEYIAMQDVRNLISGIKNNLIGADVSTTVLHFKKKQEEDPEFFYAIEPDETGAVKHIFWVDGRGRRAYKEFGEVVTIDTTYQTNMYNMPLEPILGTDHHRITIVFGIALLRNESCEDFSWLFNTWLKAMNGNHPKAIITDQDKAMKKAIELVFPNTIHRCCQWHVMRKAREHLGVLYNQLDGFGDELKSVNIKWRPMHAKCILERESLLGFVHEIEKDTLYEVRITTHHLYPNWRHESFMIIIDKEKGIVSCNCKGWEFEGLLCSHAIKVVHHVGMTNISSHYILKRWTRNANASAKVPISERCMELGESAELKALRLATIRLDLMEIGDIGTTSQETFKVLKRIIVEAKEKLQLLISKNVGEDVLPKDQPEIAEKYGVSSLHFYVDPPNSQCKGRRKRPVRFKPAADIKGKKQRTCSICNAKEGHNARTCPQRAKSKNKSKHIDSEDPSSEDSFSENDLDD